MTVRNHTVNKYVQAFQELERHLANDPYVDTVTFTGAYEISAGTVSEMVRRGFLTRIGRGQYKRTSKPITFANVKHLLEERETDRDRTTRKAANDDAPAKQGQLDLVQPTPAPTVSREAFEALERRVASLEQLLIRRGVA